MRRFLIRWFINTVALWAAVQLVPGIEYRGNWQGLALLALIFGIVNALIGPILRFLTCPLIVLTLGLFTLILNAVMLALTAWIGQQLGFPFYIHGLIPALWGAIVISVVSLILNIFLGERR
ncbi:MAG: phage holin family protein [Anaerolineae bacterium]|nr:phage holin family protein [Anaerolineae bacterium]MDW8102315.1 phage holin family protein [Anaerolineae bacterium]